MTILIVIEGVRLKNYGWALLVESGREKGARSVVAHHFDCREHTHCVLLVTDLFQTQLLRRSDCLQNLLARPFEVIVSNVLIVGLKHGQLSNGVLNGLNGRPSTFDSTLTCSCNTGRSGCFVAAF